MNYRQKIVVDAPVERVAELFGDPDNMMKWFPDFMGIEHISGEPGKPGAKSRLRFKMKLGEFEMIETITVNNLPHEFSSEYETLGMGISNTMRNWFKPLGEGSTSYETEIDYRFSGIKWRLMSLFMGPLFRRQSFKVMKRFKEFVESQPPAGAGEGAGTGPAGAG